VFPYIAVNRSVLHSVIIKKDSSIISLVALSSFNYQNTPVFSGKVCVVIGSLGVPLFIFSVLRIPKKTKKREKRDCSLCWE
jgi:hypothetical protein